MKSPYYKPADSPMQTPALPPQSAQPILQTCQPLKCQPLSPQSAQSLCQTCWLTHANLGSTTQVRSVPAPNPFNHHCKLNLPPSVHFTPPNPLPPQYACCLLYTCPPTSLNSECHYIVHVIESVFKACILIILSGLTHLDLNLEKVY